jgi:hypothetical protein
MLKLEFDTDPSLDIVQGLEMPFLNRGIIEFWEFGFSVRDKTARFAPDQSLSTKAGYMETCERGKL